MKKRITIKDFPELFNYAQNLLSSVQKYGEIFVKIREKAEEMGIDLPKILKENYEDDEWFNFFRPLGENYTPKIGDVVLIVGEPHMDDETRGHYLVEAEIVVIETIDTLKENYSWMVTLEDLIERAKKSDDGKLYGFHHTGNAIIGGLRTRQNIIFKLR
ncbi:MAG: hypothetical protein QXV73_04485 [Candidatus Micrarchaeia archaeon]